MTASRNAVRRWWSLGALLIGLAAGVPILVAVGVEDRRWEAAEESLTQMLRASREGDFATAWASYRRVFELSGDSRRLARRWGEYCRDQPLGCPSIWTLARLLGKPRSELEFLHGACPDMGDARCLRWADRVRRELTHLGSAAPGRPAAQDVAIELGLVDARPVARIGIGVESGDEEVWALVDTGRLTVMLSPALARKSAQAVEGVGDLAWHRRGADASFYEWQRAAVRDFRLGSLRLERAAANIEHLELPWDALIGMQALLRYDAACFAWPEGGAGGGTLHLGTLGPCRGGESPDRAFLSWRTGGQPVIEAVGRDGAPVHVLVDTGAVHTHCSERFAARNGGGPIRLGAHPSLSVRCMGEDPYPMPRFWEPIQVVVGMEFLGAFAAFGWELAPLRLYFVPREDA